ncbi:hypothetical protein JCM11251_000347 [Rhodosporidiobolus azoricus]
MFWRSIPRARDVLARPDDLPAGHVQRSIPKPSLPTPPQRPPPPPSAPPADFNNDDDDNDDGRRSPAPRPRSRVRRLSLSGKDALKKAAQRVIADGRRERDGASPHKQDMHDVVVAAVEQQRGGKDRRGGGGLASRVVKRRKSVGEFLKLNKRKEHELHDLDAELEATRVTPFDASAPPSLSAARSDSSNEDPTDEEEGRMSRFEASKGDLRGLERRFDSLQLGRTDSTFPGIAPSSPLFADRRRPLSPQGPPPISFPPSDEESDDDLPPYVASALIRPPPPSSRQSSTSSAHQRPAPYASSPPPITTHTPSFEPSRRATTAYEPYQPRQAERRAVSRPSPARRETSPAVPYQLDPYQQALRQSIFLAPSDSNEADSTYTDKSSIVSLTSDEEEAYESDVASSLAPAPPSAFSHKSSHPPPSRPTLPRSKTLPPPVLPVPPPLPAHYTSTSPPPVPPLPSSGSNKTKTLGPAGLTNLGNTCFLACVVQCLVATEPLVQFFLSGEYEKEINTRNKLGTKGQLARAFAHIARQLRSGERDFVSPSRLRDVIIRSADQFDNREQHDAHDLLLFLLDTLHEDLNLVLDPPPPQSISPAREAELEQLPEVVAADQEWAIYRERSDSLVIDFFQGQVRNRLECMTCQQTSTTFSPLQSLSLSIPPPSRGLPDVSLQQCIDDFLREEILSGENAWNCPRCRRPREASKRFSVARLPQFLIIHLKRFVAFDSFSSKIETPVTFPLDRLELGSLLPPMAFSPLFRLNSPLEQQTTYELYGVCVHLGTDGGGHYKALVRYGGRWFETDDETVKEVSKEDVLATAANACLLFYQIVR